MAVLTNLLDGRTTIRDEKTSKFVDEVLGDSYFSNRWALVNLEEPMMTDVGLERLEEYLDAPLNPEGRGIKNAYTLIKEDGVHHIIGESRFNDYLVQFKKLMERELKKIIE